MTRKELLKKIDSTEAIYNTLFNLKMRWMDEKHYEDIADYLRAIQKLIPQAKTIRRDPFGITCICTDGKLDVNVLKRGNTLVLQYKQR